jgi:hypothetical protein
MSGNPYPVGLSFGGPAAQRMERQLAVIARENKRRRPCPHCRLAVLPETMARHIAIVHGDGE